MPGDTIELVAVSAPWGGFACNLKAATLSAGWREGGTEPDVEAYGPPDPTVQGAFAAAGPLRGKASRGAASEGEVAWLEAFDAALAEVVGIAAAASPRHVLAPSPLYRHHPFGHP